MSEPFLQKVTSAKLFAQVFKAVSTIQPTQRRPQKVTRGTRSNGLYNEKKRHRPISLASRTCRLEATRLLQPRRGIKCQKNRPSEATRTANLVHSEQDLNPCHRLSRCAGCGYAIQSLTASLAHQSCPRYDQTASLCCELGAKLFKVAPVVPS